jgi:hypothetical protein
VRRSLRDEAVRPSGGIDGFRDAPPILRVIEQRGCRMGGVKRNPSSGASIGGRCRALRIVRNLDGFRYAAPILRDYAGPAALQPSVVNGGHDEQFSE